MRRSDEPLAEHVIEEFAKEAKLCAREWVDVVMRCGLVILRVNFMIKLMMRGHVLSLFSQEHIEKVLVGLRDDFGEERSASSVGRGSECRADIGAGWWLTACKAAMSK